MNRTQKAVAELMRCSSFNSFDGDHVAKKLEENMDLIEGFVWGRFGDSSYLIPLRDIAHDSYNADTLYILPKKGKENDLLVIINNHFHADEVSILEGSEVQSLMGSYGPDKTTKIIRLWWD